MNRPNRNYPQDGDNGKNVADEKPQDEHYEKLHQLPRNTPEDLAALRREVLSIFMELLPNLSSHLRRKISDLSDQDIEEVLSEAKANILSLDFTEKAPPRKDAYFYTMVRRLGFNFLRKKERGEEWIEEVRMYAEMERDISNDERDDQKLLDIFYRGIDELPVDQRDVFLFIAEERTLKNKEIADSLGVSEGTVASQIRLARQKLIAYLLRHGPDDLKNLIRRKLLDSKRKGKKS